MKRPLPTSSGSEERARKKPRRMTPSQRSRKRELDREAQRNARAKTKNHIAYLENLVQGVRGNDDRVAELVRQLDEKQATIQRLQTVMGSIGKLVEGSRIDTSTPRVVHEDIRAMKRDHGILSPTSTYSSHETSAASSEARPTTSSAIEPTTTPSETSISLHPEAFTPAPAPTCTSTSIYKPYQKQSIAQTAASIAGNTALEGRLWYLAGALLNQIHHTPSSAPLSTSSDADIAIRAVFHGWSAVIERYPLDRGWQWLKELDERIYFHLPPPHRLVHLRNCRLVFLRQLDPTGPWDELMPPYFAQRPRVHVPYDDADDTTQHHDPLVEYFPWPGFRDRLLRSSPLKFARDGFNEAIQTYLHVPWQRDAEDMYVADPATGLLAYSRAFEEFVMDLRCYSAAPEFFERFPELRGDIPCLGSWGSGGGSGGGGGGGYRSRSPEVGKRAVGSYNGSPGSS